MAHLAEDSKYFSFHSEVHTERKRNEPRQNDTRHILSNCEVLPLHLQSYLREVRKIGPAVASP
mgnify:CR=1 FL=1